MDFQSRSATWINFICSCITHALLIAPAVYIVILCAQSNYSLFIWHPTCLAVGCGFLMTEAVFAVSGESLLGSNISRSSRIKIHWVLHVLGLALLIIGFGVIVANKNINNASHFTSDHGKLGLSTFIVALVVALGGFSTLFAGVLSKNFSLASIKLIHSCGGIIVTILLIASLISGMYRPWWPGSNIGRILNQAAYVIGGFFILIRPIHSTALKIRGLFN